MRCNTLLVLILVVSSLVFIPYLDTVQSEDVEYDFILSIQESGLKDISAVFVSPDGTKAGLITDSTTVYVYDLSLRRMSLQKEFDDISIHDGCWLDVGIVLLVSSGPSTSENPDPILILSPADLSETSTRTIDSMFFSSVYPSPDRSKLALVTKKVLWVIEASSFTSIYEFEHPTASVRTVGWNSDGTKLASTGSRIYIHDLESGTNTRIPDSQKTTKELLWTSDGSFIYNLENGGILEKYDAIQGELSDTEPIASQLECGAISSDDGTICYGEGSSLAIRSLSSYEVMCRLNDATDEIDDIIWDQNDFRIITIAEDGVFRVYLDRNDPRYNNPPTITITSPVQDQTVSGDITARGSITDDEQVLSAYYKLNEGSWTILEVKDSWEFEISGASMNEGVNTLVVKASDGDLEGIETVTFNYDGTSGQDDPPTIVILSPVQGSTVQEDMDVRLEIAGGQGDIENVEVRLNEGEWTGYDGSRFFNLTIDISDLPEGEVILEVKATDGNEYSEVARVLLDHDVPYNEPEEPVGMNLIVIVMVVVAIVVTVVIVYRRRS